MFNVTLNSSWLKINWSQLKKISSKLNCIEKKNRGTFPIQLNILILQLTVYPSCLCLCSLSFWRKYSYNWIWNDIGRNCLLGYRKKIAKFLIRTFTCRSTFFYKGKCPPKIQPFVTKQRRLFIAFFSGEWRWTLCPRVGEGRGDALHRNHSAHRWFQIRAVG